MEEAIVREFFDAWSLYNQILDGNYMFHDDLYQSIKSLLTRHYGDRPLKVLDLGCGSARHFASVLREQKIANYRGYDLSEVAIAKARENLAPIQEVVKLCQGDLLAGLQETSESFDLIFSSFALHHLSLSEKSQFFRLASEKLNPQGLLLLIDVMREETEDRDQYFQHYSAWIESDWTAIAPLGKESIYEHIQNHDFPETASTIKTLSSQAGFSSATEISRFRWHQVWTFEKNSDPILCPHCLRTASNGLKCKGICVADNDY
jgi:cyclopropane fatty-acyl-phospholipid synthase-like methyltransferase